MATALIAPTVATANSADFDVTDAPVTLSLNGQPVAGPGVSIQIKTSTGAYVTIGHLDATDSAKVLDGPGTYRVAKVATGAALGVDRS